VVEISRFLDELYAVPPKDFTSARNAKAAELTAAGHADDAKAVRRLGKPSASLWATNQLARLDPERVAHFVDLVQQARRTQLRDPRGAAETLRAQRVELDALTTAAVEAMTKAGYPVSRATRGRVSDTLLGAAVDDRLADELRRGRLTSELSAPGFEIFAGAPLGTELRLVRGGKPAESRSERAAAQRAREQSKQERQTRAAEAERQAAARRAEAAERAAREAREAEHAMREAESTAHEAENAVRELERQLADARRRWKSAQRESVAAARRARRSTGR
jgi:hypothetical protein